MDIIISGASVAGLATAHLLAAQGHTVTVVERSVRPRRGGVAVDVRGDALDVARRMGIFDEVSRRRVAYEDRFDFVDSRGEVQATLRPAQDFYDSPQDIEISRDVLSEILVNAVPKGVTMLYGSWIEAIAETTSDVLVDIYGHGRHRADLVVGADGLHSRVRQLTFGPEEEFTHHLGLYVGVLSQCGQGDDIFGSAVYNEPDRMVMLRGDGEECSALLGFRSPPIEYDYRDVGEHKRLVAEAFADVTSWRVPAVLAELRESDDFYFDSVSQVKMPSWVNDRVALVGDAGYCASFFSGMGTSLAMVGADRLASALDGHPGDVGAALAEYDRSMVPMVDEAHGLAGGGAAILFPATDEDIAARNAQLLTLGSR